MFDDLNKILETRAAPQAPTNLSARIIEQAARTPQSAPALKGFDLRGLWNDFQEMIAIPAPAYAFAVMFVLGISAGVMGDISAVLPGLTTNDLSDFMMINDSFTAGEWL